MNQTAIAAEADVSAILDTTGLTPLSCTGRVVAANVTGWGQNSAQFFFNVRPSGGGQDMGFIVTAYLAYEPQVFSSIVTMITAAFYAKRDVQVLYYIQPTNNYCQRVILC